MQLSDAIKGMNEHRNALIDISQINNPSYISEHTHHLAQYIAAADACISDIESELEIEEAKLFKEFVKQGMSANAAKESVKREFIEQRAQIIKTARLISSGWKLVSASQSRVKHLIAEANNQI